MSTELSKSVNLLCSTYLVNISIINCKKLRFLKELMGWMTLIFVIVTKQENVYFLKAVILKRSITQWAADSGTAKWL